MDKLRMYTYRVNWIKIRLLVLMEKKIKNKTNKTKQTNKQTKDTLAEI